MIVCKRRDNRKGVSDKNIRKKYKGFTVETFSPRCCE